VLTSSTSTSTKELLLSRRAGSNHPSFFSSTKKKGEGRQIFFRFYFSLMTVRRNSHLAHT
jgi:hypothetical protein